MLGRAKNHPNKTKDMDDAIVIFEKWMRMYKKNKKEQIKEQYKYNHLLKYDFN